DMTTTVDGGQYPSGYRVIDKRSNKVRFVETKLTPKEAPIIARLIENRPKAILMRHLVDTAIDDSDRLIERARTKVDVELTRRNWRGFKTLPGDAPADKMYRFSPPDGTTWIFLGLLGMFGAPVGDR